jgi:glycosyltransferase involved in cell wall biosynthesis
LAQGGPLVTIGMPAYNGGRYLAKALDSLLAQDYRSWELVISDDCSTDDTEAVARAYASRDARIRYIRQPSNVGEMANFNFALGQARGPYFMWAADHDLWQPTFISRCVAALEARPEAVLAYPQSLLVDEDGAAIEEMDDQIDLEQTTALARYKHLIWNLSICNMIYGVARRDAMVAAGGYRDVLAPDRLVLARLALQGPILRTGGLLYLRRRNRPPETADQARLRQLADLNPVAAGERTAMPAPRLFRALRDLHLQAVAESPMSFSEKLNARIATLACFHLRFHVASNVVRVQKGLAILTRQTPRLERWWGRRG